jgi:hypothetical protein
LPAKFSERKRPMKFFEPVEGTLVDFAEELRGPGNGSVCTHCEYARMEIPAEIAFHPGNHCHSPGKTIFFRNCCETGGALAGVMLLMVALFRRGRRIAGRP